MVGSSEMRIDVGQTARFLFGNKLKMGSGLPLKHFECKKEISGLIKFLYRWNHRITLD